MLTIITATILALLITFVVLSAVITIAAEQRDARIAKRSRANRRMALTLKWNEDSFANKGATITHDDGVTVRVAATVKWVQYSEMVLTATMYDGKRIFARDAYTLRNMVGDYMISQGW